LLARSPGKVPVRMRLRGEDRELLMRSRNTSVTPTRELLDSIAELIGEERVHLECAKPSLKPLQERRWRTSPDKDESKRSVTTPPPHGNAAPQASRPVVDTTPPQ